MGGHRSPAARLGRVLIDQEAQAVEVAIQFAVCTLALERFTPAAEQETVYHRRFDRILGAVSAAKRKADRRSDQARHRLKACPIARGHRSARQH
jgi:hypothetical protein